MRPLNKIAAEILADWGPPGKNPPAFKVWGDPYVQAMLTLTKVTDTFGVDPADDIILRFLANAGSWRGPVAQRVKAELKQHLKEYNANH